MAEWISISIFLSFL